MDHQRLREIRQQINDPNVCWNERAHEIAKDLIAEVDRLAEKNGMLDSIASNGWVEAWHCGNGFMALPPHDDHGTVLRCWQESQTLKLLQEVNGQHRKPPYHDLVRRAVRGLKSIGSFPAATDPHPLDCSLAGRVAHVFGIGMTRAIELCRACCEDPEYRRIEQCQCGEPCDSTGYCDDCLGG